jgi:8-oxo-dGTP pyrophosphatase MutT (NUDIX family)
MADYHYFLIDGYKQPFGYIRSVKVEQIKWPDYWKVDSERKTLILSAGKSIDERNEFMAKTLLQEHERREVTELRKLSAEMYPIYGLDGELVLSISRSASDLFGIETYGVFLIASVQKDGVQKFWVATRSLTKATYPGKLDMCVGGSVQTQEPPLDCLVREAEEEASLPPDFTRKFAQPCGTVRYHLRVDDHGRPGSRAQTQFVYELELPADMVPKPCDDEVKDFRLMSIEEIGEALENRDFKLNIAMTWMDYMIRHGYVNSENEKHYVEITSRLHRNLDFFIV